MAESCSRIGCFVHVAAHTLTRVRVLFVFSRRSCIAGDHILMETSEILKASSSLAVELSKVMLGPLEWKEISEKRPKRGGRCSCRERVVEEEHGRGSIDAGGTYEVDSEVHGVLRPLTSASIRWLRSRMEWPLDVGTALPSSLGVGPGAHDVQTAVARQWMFDCVTG